MSEADERKIAREALLRLEELRQDLAQLAIYPVSSGTREVVEGSVGVSVRALLQLEHIREDPCVKDVLRRDWSFDVDTLRVVIGQLVAAVRIAYPELGKEG